jgi:hypothetical protein
VGAKAISPTRRSSDDPNETKMPKRKQETDDDTDESDTDESDSEFDAEQIDSSESESGGNSAIYVDSEDEKKMTAAAVFVGPLLKVSARRTFNEQWKDIGHNVGHVTSYALAIDAMEPEHMRRSCWLSLVMGKEDSRTIDCMVDVNCTLRFAPDTQCIGITQVQEFYNDACPSYKGGFQFELVDSYLNVGVEPCSAKGNFHASDDTTCIHINRDDVAKSIINQDRFWQISTQCLTVVFETLSPTKIELMEIHVERHSCEITGDEVED